jgi:hypothetical protein
MQIIKKEQRLIDVVVENYTICDKCGNHIKTTIYDAFTFELEYKTGNSYPEGGNGEKHTLDLCQICAPIAITLLEKNGFKVQHSEWDF